VGPAQQAHQAQGTIKVAVVHGRFPVALSIESSLTDPIRRLSTHYQWVIFLVVVVVLIAGIWIGACIWRRRYLRRKDRQYALGKRLAHQTESGRVIPNAGSNAASVHIPSAGVFQPAPISSAGVYDDKPAKKSKKKWIVRERT
jgi:hypothetical protein